MKIFQVIVMNLRLGEFATKWLRSNCGSVGDHTFDTIGCIGAENLNEGWGFIKLAERTRSDSMT